jgi:iron complex outermembrane receptor protein
MQALWTLGPWAVNARGTIYGPSTEIVTNSTFGNIPETIPTTGIMDLDVSYKFTDNIKLAIGANNLFNNVPPLMPQIKGAPANGALVYNVPLLFSPYGTNGGYYYGRLTITF